MNERVLVTGADGFVGKYVCRTLIASGFIPHAGVRTLQLWPELQRVVPGLTEYSLLGDLSEDQNLGDHLKNVSAVVHLAARPPVMSDRANKASPDYRRVNVDATKSIALAAVAAGVRRFIFVSSVKVHGESTMATPFSEDSPADPQNPYAASKWEAEEMLHGIAAKTGLELVVVRPPQVYGPGVRGNFLRLMRLVDRALPLPLPKGKNCRSLLGAENLADFLVLCVHHRNAAGQTFLVKDSEDHSTRELIVRLAQFLARPVRLVPIPEPLIRLAAKLTLKEEEAGRVLDSLVIDSRRAQQRLQWDPPVRFEVGLAATARWYRELTLAERAKAS
jgi:nucleoside-diphosphate-sugar epimerase